MTDKISVVLVPDIEIEGNETRLDKWAYSEAEELAQERYKKFTLTMIKRQVSLEGEKPELAYKFEVIPS